MQGDDDVLAVIDVAAHPFDHVGIDVRRRHLDGGRQVEDQLVVRRRLDDVDDRVRDFQRDIEFGAGEAFRRIFETITAAGLSRHVGDHLRRIDGDLLDAGDILAEHHTPLQLGGRVVEVDDRLVCAFQRLEGAGDQLRPALHQHLQRHVLGHVALLDAPAGEIEICLRGRGEADLDFLETHLEEQQEHAGLAVMAHWVDQRLVTVAQVHRAPDRRLGDGLARPGTIRNIDLRIGPVFRRGFRHALFCDVGLDVHRRFFLLPHSPPL